MADEDPSKLSGDMEMMRPDWHKVETLFAGLSSLREQNDTYLPQFPDETADNWKFRTSVSKLTNIWRDIIEDLTSRPMTKPIKVSDDSDPMIKEFSEDVDARGTSLHEFADDVFFNSIGYGLDWIVVDYTKAPQTEDGRELSVAEEEKLGLRPFWRRYTAPSCVAAYSAIVDGREEIIHIRFLEAKVERDGFDEKVTERVRVWDREQMGEGRYGPATFAIWEKHETKDGEEEWIMIEEPQAITLPIIPVVPCVTGRRKGDSWVLDVPMKEAADLQLTHFRQESALEYAKVMSCFPILTGNGIAPEFEEGTTTPKKIDVGPKTVLYAPPVPGSNTIGEWRFIEPSADSLTFMASDVKETGKELRELGRQPLTASMGNITVITSAVAGQKGASAIQAWAIDLQQALERACEITQMWLKSTGKPAQVMIDTEFDLTWTDDDGFEHVMALRKDNEISREQVVHEAKRRDILDREYDPDEDLEKIVAELEEIDAEGGNPGGDGEDTPPGGDQEAD